MLIFDLDGTLWNTTKNALEAANKISEKYDEIEEITEETVKKGMGLSAVENAKNYMPYLENKKALYYLKMMDKRSIELINEKGAALYEGLEKTIYSLQKKYKLGIITNNTDEYVETFFKVSNLKDYFIDYIGAASYSITKGEAIKNMIERNHEKNSFYIGDIKKDMIATEEAGINFIHAKYGFEPTLKTKYFIEDIRELEELLNRI